MSVIFISHSSRDNDESAKVREWLKSQGHHSVFLDFDPQDGIPAGRDWEQELYSRLRACRAVILLCSEHSMASDWCFAEITQTRALGKALLPIIISECAVRSVLHDTQILNAVTMGWDDTFERLSRSLRLAGVDPDVDWVGDRAPYPGLACFQEKDGPVFFGREAEIGRGLELLERVRRFRECRSVFLLGGSGSGKSSLLRAGLVPRLRRNSERWLVIGPMKPGQDPFLGLSRSLAHQCDEGAEQLYRSLKDDPDQGLERAFREVHLKAGKGSDQAAMVIVIDQFEELLEQKEGHPAEQFLELLTAGRHDIILLASMRSDFRDTLRFHFPEILSLSVGPLERTALAQVIEGPAKRAGLELEAGLCTKLLDDTGSSDALPLLAFTLRELYERRSVKGSLRLSDYADIGGLKGAVAQAAEDLLATASGPEELKAIRRAFLLMVRMNEEGHYARRPALWSELPVKAKSMLDKFVEGRLLVTSQAEGKESILEVAHEALFRNWEQLIEWLEQEDDALRVRRRLVSDARDWSRAKENPELLFKEPYLTQAETLLLDYALDPLEKEYLERSRDQQDEELRKESARNRQLANEQRQRAEEAQRSAHRSKIAALVVSTLLLVVTLSFYGNLRLYRASQISEREARQQTRQAVADRLASQALEVDDLRPQLGALLAASAYQLGADGSPRPEEALWEAVSKLRGRPLSGVKGQMEAVAVSPNGRWIAVACESSLGVWSLSELGEWNETASLTPGSAVALTDQLLAVGTAFGELKVWSLDGLGREPEVFNTELGEISSLDFGGDDRLVCATRYSGVTVWSRDGGKLVEIPPLENRETLQAKLDPDGRTLATTSHQESYRAEFWDLDRPSKPVRLLKGVSSLDFYGPRVALGYGKADGGGIRLESWPLKKELPEEWEPLGCYYGGLRVVEFSPDGKQLLSGDSDALALLWDLGRGTHQVLTGHDLLVRDVGLGAGWLVTAGHYGARLWSASDPLAPGVPASLGGFGDAWSVDFSADGRWLAIGSGSEVRVLNAATHQEFSKQSVAGPWSARFSPDGRRLALGLKSGGVDLWDVSDQGTLAHQGGLGGHQGTTSVQFSRGGSLAATWDAELVRFWDLSRLDAPLWELRPPGRVTAVEISPNSKKVGLAFADGMVKVWSLPISGDEPELVLDHEGSFVYDLAFTEDGRRLAAGVYDQMVWLWDLETREARRLSGHNHGVSAVEFLPGDKQLISAAGDGVVGRFDVASGRLVQMRRAGDVRVAEMALDPKGTHLATADSDGRVRLWELALPLKQARLLAGRDFGGDEIDAFDLRQWGRLRADRGPLGSLAVANTLAWDIADSPDSTVDELKHGVELLGDPSSLEPTYLDTLAKLHSRLGHHQRAVELEARALREDGTSEFAAATMGYVEKLGTAHSSVMTLSGRTLEVSAGTKTGLRALVCVRRKGQPVGLLDLEWGPGEGFEYDLGEVDGLPSASVSDELGQRPDFSLSLVEAASEVESAGWRVRYWETGGD